MDGSRIDGWVMRCNQQTHGLLTVFLSFYHVPLVSLVIGHSLLVCGHDGIG